MRSKYFYRNTIGFSILVLTLFLTQTLMAQVSEFTYQGRLSDSTPSASYDLNFRLCSSISGDCTAPLATDTVTGVTLGPGGIFSVLLDFGVQHYDSNFDRFVEVSVKRSNDTEFTTLAPRTKLTATPLSVFARTAGNAMTLEGLGASDFIQDNDPRIQDGYNVRSGSTLQPGVNFNIGGTGTANILNAGTQFNLGGNRILSNAGLFNLFAGADSGAVTTGGANAFFGGSAGQVNTTGNNNSFVGAFSGTLNTTGHYNSFFGASSGDKNSTGFGNTFMGFIAGSSNTTGNENSFLGENSGQLNTTGSNNTAVGSNTSFSTNNLSYATAIGSGATAIRSNTVVLGRPADIVEAPNNLEVANYFTASSISARLQYNLNGIRFLSNAGNVNNAFVGMESYCSAAGGKNTFVGTSTGHGCTTGSNNTVLGFEAGRVGSGSNNVILGAGAQIVGPVGSQVNNSIAIGAGVTVSSSNSIVLGTPTETTTIPGKLIVRDTGSSGQTAFETIVSLHPSWGRGIGVNSLHVTYFPRVFLDTPLCFQAGLSGTGHSSVGLCPAANGISSLKTDAKEYIGGMEIVKRLKPMSFSWKEYNSKGIGLNADEVAAIDEQLVTRDEKGEILRVSADSINAILINALKQQQDQIEAQQKQIDSLKKLMCSTASSAEICKEKL